MKNSKNLDILFIVDELPSMSTPFILNQIIGLIEVGHNVLIWSRLKGDYTKVHQDFINYNIEEKIVFKDRVGFSFKDRILYFFKKGFVSFIKNPKLFFKSLNFVKFGRYAIGLRLFEEVYGYRNSPRFSFDIIHAQFGPLGKSAQRLRDIGFLKGKLITQFRGYDVSKNILFEGKNYYDYLFQKGDYFLANSEFFKRKAIDLGCPADRISVQYSGVQISKFDFQKRHPVWTKENTVKIGSVGRLTGKKGYEYCIRAIHELTKKGYDLRYEIIGDGELKKNLEDLVSDLGLKDRVFFLGKRSHSEIANFLKEINLFLSHNVTSKQGDQDAPVNTLKEAMLSGNIVISTYHGGIPELVQHNKSGFLSNEKNVEELVNIIETKFFNNPNLNEVSQNARSIVKKSFDNLKLNEQLEHVYLKCLK